MMMKAGFLANDAVRTKRNFNYSYDAQATNKMRNL
jgi:hypothetical protein